MSNNILKPYDIDENSFITSVLKSSSSRFSVEGVISEFHLNRILGKCELIVDIEWRMNYSCPDFIITLINGEKISIECKNLSRKNYSEDSKTTYYRVETQKSRNSKDGSPTRLYDDNLFQILAVCLGKQTGNWKQFYFIDSKNLKKHNNIEGKIATFQRVPLEENEIWIKDIKKIILGMR